jgi:ATP-dependent exoDNAse (exonuclease V) beta subunit
MWKGDSGEREEIKREHQRLLYVAMTRARDHLIMLGTLGNGKTPVKQNTWLDYLHRTILQRQNPGDATGSRAVRYSYPLWQAENIIEQRTGNNQGERRRRSSSM